ncbi:MAG: hypothetical protein AAB588_05085 [Patescibacteria group bacterium]
MNDEKEEAENEIVKEAVAQLDGRPTEDDNIATIRKRSARAAKLAPSSAIRIGRKFLQETDVEKH